MLMDILIRLLFYYRMYIVKLVVATLKKLKHDFPPPLHNSYAYIVFFIFLMIIGTVKYCTVIIQINRFVQAFECYCC